MRTKLSFGAVLLPLCWLAAMSSVLASEDEAAKADALSRVVESHDP